MTRGAPGAGSRSVRSCRDPFAPVPPGAVAVDLGCGDGTETMALLRAGFTVDAMDASPDAIQRTTALAGSAARRLTPTLEGLETYAVPSADLVHAGFSLPFCKPDAFPELWARIRAALRPGSVVAVTLFGDRDSWASETEMTFVSAPQVDELVVGLVEVDVVEEEEPNGTSFSGPKH